MLRIPSRRVLADDVYEQIRALIMSDGIEPGARVNIDEIARQLDVSPTPVREALARLESEELVSRLPLRGYRVTDLLNRKQVDDLYALRLLLEPPSAALAAARMTPENVVLIEEELATCPAAPADDAYDDYKNLTAHDQRLHELILRIAGNDAVLQSFAKTHCHLHLFRLNFQQPFGVQTITEHRAIVDALVAGDSDGARDAMTAHLEVARARLLDRM
ncbi:GntR family transcriptional regulator [Lentzea aerocolonigenes]|uniref:GntR family transcriptional regulator n=1 Tax=Lentzea aerocolonigenes TaxID=68170 RepID=UPI000B3296F5|nr:GntR family transcriptional regulator [Lentzea aerocolonigenes]MCP2244114.1 DNA-binding transcriptional regulator, GntR family [Lentzea aerocolonigenes]